MPTLPITIPAATFANCTATSAGIRAAMQAATTATTVSPAPETSKTCRAAAGTCVCESCRRIAIPFSLSVTSMYCRFSAATIFCPAFSSHLRSPGSLAGHGRQFLRVGTDRSCAAIPREVAALGIDYHRNVQPSRLANDAAAYPFAQRALGVVREHHDRGFRQRSHHVL